MKNCKIVLALGAALALLGSCSPKASFTLTVKDAPGVSLAIHKLDVSTTELLDSVTTDANGRFRYSVDAKKGDPDFIYVFSTFCLQIFKTKKGKLIFEFVLFISYNYLFFFVTAPLIFLLNNV